MPSRRNSTSNVSLKSNRSKGSIHDIHVKSDEAAVYDPYTHELKILKVNDINKDPRYKRVDIPKIGKKVDIHLSIDPEDKYPDRFLATVNLRSLGFKANMRRHFGQLKCIYVLDRGADESIAEDDTAI